MAFAKNQGRVDFFIQIFFTNFVLSELKIINIKLKEGTVKMKLDHQNVWNICMDLVSKSIDPLAFQTWFEPIVPLRLEKDVLTIQVPSVYFYEIIEEQYIDHVRRALHDVIGNSAKLEYSVVMDKGQKRNHNPYTLNLPTANRADLRNRAVSPGSNNDQPAIKNPFVIPGIKKLNVDPQLNADYTFENFVEGDCNRLARSASQAVAKNPGKTAFNPLFIYGNSGLGKTHLAQAIGIDVKQSMPEKTVLYVSANKFQTQYTDSIRNNSLNDFLNFYQMIDVLIMDDIQEFAGKTGTQNTFFHIFNHLQQSGKQLILTSDQAPADLQGMEERLLSRFKWGLPADLQAPDFETRVDILKHKIRKDGINVSPEVVHYLASHINHNVRELEGALISLLFLSTINRDEISLETAKSVVDKLVRKSQRELSVDFIQKTVCKYYGLDPESLQSKTRKREIVQARQIAMYFSKNLTNSSLSAIGSKIGKKDHATVLHACKTITNLIETDRDFKSQIREIESQLKC
ncbi:chromosomal replication initiator protein [Alkalitalea saponilacus]|uniref:Chromosomal replication initiator protein DnaA n=2 Tax=Alkalitalea saponilacus TaxID=889453 RepID=A0A1T5HT08_9BACT|nr:chromosomal replication initiator protein [Alkalitalea saponilacus]